MFMGEVEVRCSQISCYCCHKAGGGRAGTLCVNGLDWIGKDVKDHRVPTLLSLSAPLDFNPLLNSSSLKFFVVFLFSFVYFFFISFLVCQTLLTFAFSRCATRAAV